jgi:hypothetical protein
MLAFKKDKLREFGMEHNEQLIGLCKVIDIAVRQTGHNAKMNRQQR